MKNQKGLTLIESMVIVAIVGILIACLFGMQGCKLDQRTQTVKATQSDKAKRAADSIRFTENAEIDNIKKRLELTSNPGLLGFVLLMNEAGQPIMYTGVKGKITSGGKRLTRGQILEKGDRGNNYGHFVMKSPSDEGTWGSSNPYIYFWTTQGQYMQWNGKYLYSDKPFRTKIEPLIIGIEQ